MKVVYKIDGKGYYIEDVVVGDNEELTDNYITHTWNDRLYKPKWDGSKWIEGATQEEIEEYNFLPPQPLSEIEQLRLEQAQANSELVQLIMMMGGA